ncbi:MAG: hypothetical protein ACI8V2_004523 [Candidatus Latescibacterota bacterium]
MISKKEIEMDLSIIEKGHWEIKSPPIPHEHGAWFMLYIPMIVVLVGARADWAPAIVLVLTVTGGFLAQHVMALMLRGRSHTGDGLWLIVYGGLFLAGSSSLVTYGSISLLWFGIPIVFLMAWQLARSRFSRKRVDRTLSGEMLAIVGLTVTGPIALVVTRADVTSLAIGFWGLFALFFFSSVFYVKMRIQAVQVKTGIKWMDRLRLGNGLLLYHMVLGLNLLVFMQTSEIGLFLAIAFAPIFIRAVWGVVSLSNTLPKLQVIGGIEALYTLWFSGWVVVVLRTMVG